MSALRVAAISPEHAGAVQELFAHVFGKPMSEPLWRWKYAGADRQALGVWEGDRLVAHYGGIGADIVMDGKPARAVQSVDVMVAPSVRQAVRQHSPFFLSTSGFLDRYIGYTRPYLLGYGFPSDRHLQLAQHLGLYAQVGGMSELTLAGQPRRWADRVLRMTELSATQVEAGATVFDPLWQRMQASLPAAILVRKQHSWLRHRYLQHPEQQYRYWLWRQPLSGKVLALVVVKVEAARVLVMDVFASASDFPRVLKLVANHATRQLQLPTAFWISSAWVEPLQLAVIAAVERLPISTPANIWTEGPAPAVLQNRWCLTAGDTDYL